MSIEFNVVKCQTHSDKKRFGLCDDPPPPHKPAYIDEADGSKWIAVVDNDGRYPVTFTAIDNCIKINRQDGKPAKRCDGVLIYNSTIIFVELKAVSVKGNDWVEDAEKQLKTTISYFEKSDTAEDFKTKKAYIANSQHPKFKQTQSRRMDQFFIDTGYILRIENRIKLP